MFPCIVFNSVFLMTNFVAIKRIILLDFIFIIELSVSLALNLTDTISYTTIISKVYIVQIILLVVEQGKHTININKKIKSLQCITVLIIYNKTKYITHE